MGENNKQSKDKYKKLWELLAEWLKEYDNKDFLSRKKVKKYKQILNLLKMEFSDDSDLTDYIKWLPKFWIWLLRPWRPEIICGSLFVLFPVANNYIFKIYTEVILKYRTGSGFDAVYFFLGVVLGVIYICIYIKRNSTYKDLEYNLKQIKYIAGRKMYGMKI